MLTYVASLTLPSPRWTPHPRLRHPCRFDSAAIPSLAKWLFCVYSAVKSCLFRLDIFALQAFYDEFEQIIKHTRLNVIFIVVKASHPSKLITIS
uniref:Uncharacterized protein n=1 Tax=Steinernema glaseri TaxID=37863 RepID=A0A1I7ZUP4_9BILA